MNMVVRFANILMMSQLRKLQEEKPEEEELIEEKALEQSKSPTEHILREPKVFGLQYNERAAISIMLHSTVLITVIILLFVSQQVQLYWILGILYLLIQLESWKGERPAFFKSFSQVQSIKPTLKLWREAQVELKADITAYHYLKKQNKNQENEETKVQTYQKAEILEYTRCEDITEDASELLKNNYLYIIEAEVLYSYGNDKAKETIEAKINTLVNKAGESDEYVDEDIEVKLEDIQNESLTFAYVKQKPFIVNSFFYWMTSLLLFTIPYRLYINSITAKLRYRIHKKVYV